MKCRICGYEPNQGLAFCPMCGSRLSKAVPEKSDPMFKAPDIPNINDDRLRKPVAHDVEFNWNSHDFPKPKELRDIKMEWSGVGMMKDDGSEGYVSSRQTAPPAEDFRPSMDEIWKMPEQKTASDTPLWYTQPIPGYDKPQISNIGTTQHFTASGIMQTQPVWPQYSVPTQPPTPHYETPQPHQSAGTEAENEQRTMAREKSYSDSLFEEPSLPDADEGSLTLEHIVPEIGSSSFDLNEKSEEPRMFNTFYTKNEEFQELLDAEYERIRANGSDFLSPAPTLESISLSSDPGKEGEMSEFERMLMADTRDAGYSDETIAIRLPELYRDMRGELSEDVYSGATTVISPSVVTAAGEAAKGLSEELFGSAVSGKPFSEVTSSMSPDAFTKSTIELKIKELKEQEAAEGEIRSLRRKKLEEMAKAREAYFGSSRITAQDITLVEAAASAERESLEQSNVDAAATAAEAENDVKIREQRAREEVPVRAIYHSYEEDEEEKLGCGRLFLRFLLIILIIVAVFEGGYIALTRFMPDSDLSGFVGIAHEGVVNLGKEGWSRAAKAVGSLFDKGADEADKKGVNGGFDISKIIEANNRNIEIVRLDSALARSEDVEYPIEGLKEMQSADESVLEKIYGTLIGYNSAWIDYVNDGKEDCLDYLKADGGAYRSASSFDKVGRIHENFEELVLGEVLVNGEYAYVFDRERIFVKSDEGSSTQNYSWIYKMVLVGDEYKIVDYVSY